MAASPGSLQFIIDEELLRSLECPVCNKYMSGQIQICKRGHSICTKCKTHVKECPICRAVFDGGRNFVAEELANRILFPCENKILGCTARLAGSEMEQHRRCCALKFYKCMVSDCSWTGQRGALLEHFKETHSTHLLTTAKYHIKLKCSFTGKLRLVKLMHVFGETFHFFLIGDPAKKVVIFFVQYVGRIDKASDYRYNITIESEDGRHRFTFQDCTVDDSKEVCDVIQSKKHLEINEEVSKYFKNSANEMKVILHILENKI